MKQFIPAMLSFLLCVSGMAQPLLTKITENRFLVWKGDKVGVADSQHRIIVPFEFDKIEFQNKRLVVRIKDRYGLYTLNYHELLPVRYKFILPRPQDRFILLTHESLFGLADNNGNMIISPEYNFMSSMDGEHYVVMNKQKLNGVYDFHGNLVVPMEYKFFTIDGSKVFAEKNNVAQILDINHLDSPVILDSSIKLIYTERHYSSSEEFFQIIKKDEKYGLMNADNGLIIPIIYDEMKSSGSWKFFIIKKNGKYGMLKIDGSIPVPPAYEKIVPKKEGVELFRKGNKKEFFGYWN